MDNHTPKEKQNITLVMLGVMLGVLLAALDSSIVSTAMPKIVQNLHGAEYYSWVFTIYMLCSTLSIPISSKLADSFGRKMIYLTGISIFLAASMLCGLSQNMTQLIIFRGMQGVGGGIILSSAFTIVGEMFSARERGKYMGFVSSMFGLASVLGPSLGGWITDVPWLGWRWIFYVNLPLGIVALATVIKGLPTAIERPDHKRLDFLGLTTFVLGVTPLLIALSWAGTDYPWLSPTILGLLGISMLMFVLFVLIEKRAYSPIIPLHLFSRSIFNISLLATFVSGISMFGAVVFLPLYLQTVMRLTPSQSGTLITPMMVSFVIASILAGRYISSTGRYKRIALAGFSLAIVGSILFAGITPAASYTYLVFAMIIFGAGLGAPMPTFTIAVQNDFPTRQLGVVTGSLQFFRQIGSSIGIAIFGSIMFTQLSAGMADIPKPAAGFSPQLTEILNHPADLTNPEKMKYIKTILSPEEYTMVTEQLRATLPLAIEYIFFLLIFTASASLLFTIFLKEKPLRGGEPAHVPAME